MQKPMLFLFSLSVCLNLLSAEPVQVAPSDVLFLAHFDQSTEPTAGNTEGMRCPARITEGSKGFPFEGGGRQEALNLNGSGKYYLLPAAGNYDPEAGTIQMWVRPQWKGNGGLADSRVFFQQIPTAEKWGSFNWEYFHIRKRGKISSFGFNGWREKEIPVVCERSDGWIQLAVTWNAEEDIRRFYVNGKMADEGRIADRDRLMPEQIMLGGPKGWNAQSLMDEVRILRIALTPEQIKQDFESNMEGKPFPDPAARAGELRTYEPADVKEDGASMFVRTDAEETVTVPFIAHDFQVDGDMEKEVWKEAVLLPEMKTIRGESMKHRTEIRLLYSNTALYIGAVCRQDMAQLAAQYDQDEQPLWNDDNLELFFDIPGPRGGFYQLIVNALGCLTDFKDYEQKFQLPNRTIRARRLSDRWELELKIPFASFEMAKPFSGDYIGFRFNRTVCSPPDRGSFPIMKQRGNNRREQIGKLLFGAMSKADSALRITLDKDSFLPGVNLAEAALENPGKTDFSGTLTVQAQNREGKWSRISEQPIQVKAGESVKVPLKIPVNDPGLLRIAVLAKNSSGEAGMAMLPAGFVHAAPGIAKMKREAVMLKNALSVCSEVEHPVYRGAFVSLDRFLDKMDSFDAALKKALEEGTTVSAEECRDAARHIAGFQKYADEKRFLVWQTSPWEYGSPAALPPVRWNADVPLRLDFRQAGNEREAVCLIVSGLLCGNALDLRVVPRSVQKKGVFIPRDKFEVYTEEFTADTGDVYSAPLIRTDGNYIHVAPGKSVRVWIVFDSRGVPPGRYETEILLKPAYDVSAAARRIPVSATVWNFALPETHEWPLQSFMWGPNMCNYDEAALLRLVHAFHMTHGWTQGFHYTRGFRTETGLNKLPEGVSFREDLVRTANQEFFDTAKKLKMKFVFGWNLPSDIRWYELMSERMEKMGFQPRDYVFKAFIADEFVKKHIPKNAESRQKIMDLKKDWWFQAVYLSTPPPTGATMDDIEAAKLPEFFKFWTVIGNLVFDPNRGPDVIRRLKQKGCEVWSYRCNIHMDKLPILSYYRFHAWEAYLRKLDGIALWDALEPHGDPFDHADGYDDGAVRYGIDGKPVQTKVLHAVREGLEDVAYMDRLEKELQRVRANGKSFPEYEKLLADREGILKRSNQAEVDDWRLKTGLAIDRLTRE